ncbi:hypothetical protein ACFQ4C_25840 [Larkinella insperata]|uniref:Uncharacterized protein n=1 Tax=Larkinella insperata TaxID=332158 RepID=A0ABW3QJP1_9BACT
MIKEANQHWSIVALDDRGQATGVSRTEGFDQAVFSLNSYLRSGACQVVLFDQQQPLPFIILPNPFYQVS